MDTFRQQYAGRPFWQAWGDLRFFPKSQLEYYLSHPREAMKAVQRVNDPNEWLESMFSGLQRGRYTITSDPSLEYNSYCYVLEDDVDKPHKKKHRTWWSPLPNSALSRCAKWPKNVPNNGGKQAFVEFFQHHGFALCTEPGVEPGFEKVALYLKVQLETPMPVLAAKQQPNGRWRSKIHQWHDIEHELEALMGDRKDECGFDILYFKRPRACSPSSDSVGTE